MLAGSDIAAGGSGTAGEQVEAVPQAPGDLLHRQHQHARRGQFDRERQSVELLADPRDRRCVFVGDSKVGACLAGALDEQPDRVELPEGLDGLALPLAGRQRQRRYAPVGLSRHPERRAAGRNHAYVWAGA
jgi:hypothetical protein